MEICTKCASDNTIKNGKRPNQAQKYFCKNCGSYFSLTKKPYTKTIKFIANAMLEAKISRNKTAKIIECSPKTLDGWKKVRGKVGFEDVAGSQLISEFKGLLEKYGKKLRPSIESKVMEYLKNKKLPDKDEGEEGGDLFFD